MKRARTVAIALLSGYVLVVSTACDVEMARELVTLSGACIGDVATVVATHCFADLAGIDLESDAHVHEETASTEHSHDAEPLHNHEH